MDDFKPEDELKPDTSDRRPQRARKTSSAPKVPVSRQQLMMGIGILVLLLIVLGIGSTLNSSDSGDKKAAQAPATSGSSDKNIDLTGSSSMSGQNAASPSGTDSGSPAVNGQAGADAGASSPSGQTGMDSGTSGTNGQSADNSAASGNAPQTLSAPPVASTPTEAQPVQTPAGQQRVELPGDLNNALSNQQNQVDAASSDMQGSSLPLAPATVMGGGTTSKPVTAPQMHQPAATRSARHSSTRQPAASQPQQQTRPATHKPTAAKPAVKESHSAPAAPVTGGNYTLQLSSASRPDTLNAWAKKQNLSSYHVYKTTRNGQPWYVLVSGAYATPADAKRAVASLPSEVQAKSPWVKPVSQVKKESAN